ncbi:MAG: hypothetical protein BMS9Abin13_536 [Patescibacteria group bacterium]|nr:MAG: hypothetical protein BMS9Abin13_536 [Patescibacteria group bacterium]
MNTCTNTLPRYEMRAQCILIHSQRPSYNNRCLRIAPALLLHDKEEERIKKYFRQACVMFAHEVEKLKNMDKKLTMREKRHLMYSLKALLELHSTLRKK